ncbi:MAG: nuclear transport factor 2 family protein [Planctomycetota bacterium]
MDTPVSPALEVGRKLVALCSQGKYREAIVELYADDARHIESVAMGPDMPRENGPKPKLLEMNDWWEANHDVHGGELQGPYNHGDDRFAVRMTIDVTPKVGPMTGKRHVMEEVCVYTVADGKITLAEFFYDTTSMGD